MTREETSKKTSNNIPIVILWLLQSLLQLRGARRSAQVFPLAFTFVTPVPHLQTFLTSHPLRIWVAANAKRKIREIIRYIHSFSPCLDMLDRHRDIKIPRLRGTCYTDLARIWKKLTLSSAALSHSSS